MKLPNKLPVKFGLSQNDFQLIEQLAVDPLKKNGATVWVFGSRARGTHRQFSDLDLMYEFRLSADADAVEAHARADALDQGAINSLVSSIRDALEDSNVTIKVDLVSRREVAKSYALGIEKDKVEW